MPTSHLWIFQFDSKVIWMLISEFFVEIKLSLYLIVFGPFLKSLWIILRVTSEHLEQLFAPNKRDAHWHTLIEVLLLSKIEFSKIMKNFIAFFFSASEWGRILIFSQVVRRRRFHSSIFEPFISLFALLCHFVSSDVRIFCYHLKWDDLFVIENYGAISDVRWGV